MLGVPIFDLPFIKRRHASAIQRIDQEARLHVQRSPRRQSVRHRDSHIVKYFDVRTSLTGGFAESNFLESNYDNANVKGVTYLKTIELFKLFLKL